MADKYKHLKRKAQKLRKKKKMCEDKKQYETNEASFQKGQKSYKCNYCGKWHRSGQMGKFIAQLNKRKKV